MRGRGQAGARGEKYPPRFLPPSMAAPCPGAGHAGGEADGLCGLCGRGGATVCKGCGALSLCPACGPHHPPAECARFAAWVAADPPAPCTTTTTSCAVLEAAGVHGQGLWRRVCGHGGDAWGAYAPPLPQASSRSAPAPVPCLGAALFLGGGGGPAPPGVPPLTRLARPDDPPIHPALALLLHRPATAATALARALAEKREEGGPSAPTLTLALLGARAEVDAWPALLLIPCLVGAGGGHSPRYEELHIACVGPDVPAGLDGAAAVFAGPAGGVAATTRLSFHRGAWHALPASAALPTPDAVAALDAGVAAEPGAWVPTLRALVAGRRRPPPILLTDLSLPAAAGAVAVLRAALPGAAVVVTDPARNPARRPLPCPRTPGSLRMPSHECGWAFWVVEKRGV